MTARPESLKKTERLCRREAFALLRAYGKKYYARGASFIYFPAPRSDEDPAPARVAFIVPKKSLRRAPDRNRARRLLRESYRKQKSVLYDAAPPGVCCYLLVIYHRKNLSPYDEIYALTGRGLVEVAARLQPAPASGADEIPTDAGSVQ